MFSIGVGIVRSVPAETDFKRSLESSCSGDDVELGRVCPKDERSFDNQ